MTSPTIQLEPGKSISFDKLRKILEKVEELSVAKKRDDIIRDNYPSACKVVEAVNNLLEVYEDE